jgi:hypothetical protein
MKEAKKGGTKDARTALVSLISFLHMSSILDRTHMNRTENLFVIADI